MAVNESSFDYSTLSAREQEIIAIIAAELEELGQSPTLKMLESLEWKYQLPSAEQLILDPYYFGNIGKDVFPIIRKDLIDILDNPYTEVILSGSIGWGKSWLAALGIAIEMTRLACLRNPQGLLGIAQNTDMVFMNLSVRESQASNVLGNYVTSFLKASPFVMEVLKPSIKPKRSAQFPCTGCYWTGRSRTGARCPECNGTGKKHMRYLSGNSSEMSVIGENLVGGGMDEANFMISVRRSRRAKMAGEHDTAKSLYDAVVRRRESRFVKAFAAGVSVLPVYWVISSVCFPGDFTERRIALTKDNPRVKVLQYATWETKRTAAQNPYSGKELVVLVGNSLNRSRIVSFDRNNFDEKNFELPDGCRLIYPPIEHKQPFEEDIIGAIRDVAGIPQLASNPYFEYPLEPCYINKRCGDVPRVHPYEYEATKLISGSLLKSYLIPSIQTANGMRPALNPNALRYIHFDLASTGTTAAMVMGHFGGYARYTRQIVGNKRVWHVVEERAITIIDFMIRVLPPDVGRIDIDAFLELIQTLRHQVGYQIGQVTFDRFESVTSINALQSMGIDATNLSIERNQDAWTHFRDSVKDERFSCYQYAPLRDEMGAVEWNAVKMKVVKKTITLPDGYKHHCDLAEAVAGVCRHVNSRHGIVRPPLPAPYFNQMVGDLGEEYVSKLRFASVTGEGILLPEMLEIQRDKLESAARAGINDPRAGLKIRKN